jgi:hypothetical protein
MLIALVQLVLVKVLFLNLDGDVSIKFLDDAIQIGSQQEFSLLNITPAVSRLLKKDLDT